MYDEFLDFIFPLAKGAGEIQLAYFRGNDLGIETKSNAYDVVTRADKESEAYKVTVFKRSGLSRRMKPETYLLQEEENGNLFINTGFRIDVAYNEAADVLTFSPGGDYVRKGNGQTDSGGASL